MTRRVALVERSRARALVRASMVLKADSRPMLGGSEAAGTVDPWAVVLHVLSRCAVLTCPGLGSPLSCVIER